MDPPAIGAFDYGQWFEDPRDQYSDDDIRNLFQPHAWNSLWVATRSECAVDEQGRRTEHLRRQPIFAYLSHNNTLEGMKFKVLDTASNSYRNTGLYYVGHCPENVTDEWRLGYSAQFAADAIHHRAADNFYLESLIRSRHLSNTEFQFISSDMRNYGFAIRCLKSAKLDTPDAFPAYLPSSSWDPANYGSFIGVETRWKLYQAMYGFRDYQVSKHCHVTRGTIARAVTVLSRFLNLKRKLNANYDMNAERMEDFIFKYCEMFTRHNG